MAVLELRKKSQITIPKEIVDKLSLREGDKLEISEKDGVIYLLPVSVYPKKYIEELEKIAKETNRDISLGKIKIFDSVDELFSDLDNGENV